MAGDGHPISLCMDGQMKLGQMYGASRGGVTSKRYFGIIWDSHIMNRCPVQAFVLRLMNIRGCFTQWLSEYTITVLEQEEDDDLSRNVFVAQFIRMFCLEYPGVGVILRFTGSRDDADPPWVKEL